METFRSEHQIDRAVAAHGAQDPQLAPNARTASAVARRSLSRQLLLRLLVVKSTLTPCDVASHLSVLESSLVGYAIGARLMPLDVQERLAVFVEAHEPRLRRIARRLRLQVAAARRYEAGDVVRHMTSPPLRWR